jgi:hypothetical protein
VSASSLLQWSRSEHGETNVDSFVCETRWHRRTLLFRLHQQYRKLLDSRHGDISSIITGKQGLLWWGLHQQSPSLDSNPATAHLALQVQKEDCGRHFESLSQRILRRCAYGSSSSRLGGVGVAWAKLRGGRAAKRARPKTDD